MIGHELQNVQYQGNSPKSPEKFNILLARMQSAQARLSSVTSRLQRLA